MEIKFSHSYPKLHNQTSAKLLAVEVRDLSTLDPHMLEYDTIYYEADGKHYYELVPGRYMVLVFLGSILIPFTTIRKWDEAKHKYYLANIGQWFNVEVKHDI